MSEANGARNDPRMGGVNGDFFALPWSVVSVPFVCSVWNNGAEQNTVASGEGRGSV